MPPPAVSVVLVEPQGALNIGSVCRVMMNFGFTDLRLVKPRADHLSKQARDMAVSARDLLRKARMFGTLADALADCSLCLGTTRRFGKYRQDFLEPQEIAPLFARHDSTVKTALVFGREDSGLTTAELDLCQFFVTIATDPALPSLNLAQAVTICLYELSRGRHAQQDQPQGTEQTDSRTLENMYQHMRRTLVEAEYLDPQNPDHILHTFRRIFGRAGLDQREVRIIQGLWSRIDWLNSQRRQ
ncbi:MAG: RNA methyltransferase [Proteobacteria bacterium]|nr:RNA methyltransferase [Pseudomonadota bacterium]MBU0965960.1 RNA methyltransferase [Pseudomonadota bacterium]